MSDTRPHSRACGISKHEHGPDCHPNCQTCHGRDPVSFPATNDPGLTGAADAWGEVIAWLSANGHHAASVAAGVEFFGIGDEDAEPVAVPSDGGTLREGLQAELDQHEFDGDNLCVCGQPWDTDGSSDGSMWTVAENRHIAEVAVGFFSAEVQKAKAEGWRRGADDQYDTSDKLSADSERNPYRAGDAQ